MNSSIRPRRLPEYDDEDEVLEEVEVMAGLHGAGIDWRSGQWPASPQLAQEQADGDRAPSRQVVERCDQ